MVMRVCRAVLGDRHDAEDAFQATFLILASRAGVIRLSGSVAAWLYGVALRVAANARSKAIRRLRHERRLAKMTTGSPTRTVQSSTIGDERDCVIHQEIGRLPERFRTAVVLCYLEDLTHDQAALQLGCPVGTIRSRLANARERLRKRLTRRGVGTAAIPVELSGPGLITFSEPAGASLPVAAALVDATVRGALRVGLGKRALAEIVSAEAITLMEGALKTMAATKLMLLTMTILVTGLVSTGAGVAAYSALVRNDVVATVGADDPDPSGKQEGRRAAADAPTQAPRSTPARASAERGQEGDEPRNSRSREGSDSWLRCGSGGVRQRSPERKDRRRSKIASTRSIPARTLRFTPERSSNWLNKTLRRPRLLTPCCGSWLTSPTARCPNGPRR